MTKKETFKWIVQIIASVATAILTALGATSCMGTNQKSVLELFQGALVFCVVILYPELETKLTSSYNSANLFKHTTVYILQLFHCESACAHFILLFHNLLIFYCLYCCLIVLLTMQRYGGFGRWRNICWTFA